MIWCNLMDLADKIVWFVCGGFLLFAFVMGILMCIGMHIKYQ